MFKNSVILIFLNFYSIILFIISLCTTCQSFNENGNCLTDWVVDWFWLILVGSADTASLPALDVAGADPFQSLSADQSQFIDFDTQAAQLMSASTTSPVDLLLSASAQDQGWLGLIDHAPSGPGCSPAKNSQSQPQYF